MYTEKIEGVWSKTQRDQGQSHAHRPFSYKGLKARLSEIDWLEYTAYGLLLTIGGAAYATYIGFKANIL